MRHVARGSGCHGLFTTQRENIVPNTYTKLKSGEWGVRVVGGKPAEGSAVRVTKKDGGTKTEVVAKVVWSDASGRTHLVAVIQKSAGYAPRAGGRRRTGCSCGSYEDEVNAGDCFSCRHDQE